MRSLQRVLLVAALLATTIAPAALAQQAYPAKPIRVIVPYPAGGVVDLFARAVTDQLARRWSQTFIMDARPGASASIGTQAALQSEPDGYTWLVGGSSLIANPLLFKSSRWDPARDFAGLGVAGFAPTVLVVTDKLAAKSLREVVELARGKPDAVSAATMSGSAPHLSLEMLKQSADVRFLMVAYKGAPPIVADLVNGSVQISILPLTVALPQVQTGRIRALAVAANARSPLYPEVPTFAEAGFGDAVLVSWYVFVVPRATPVAVVRQINAEINEVLKMPEVRERLAKIGGEVARPMAPAEIDQMIKADYDKFAGLIKRGNITVDQ